MRPFVQTTFIIWCTSRLLAVAGRRETGTRPSDAGLPRSIGSLRVLWPGGLDLGKPQGCIAGGERAKQRRHSQRQTPEAKRRRREPTLLCNYSVFCAPANCLRFERNHGRSKTIGRGPLSPPLSIHRCEHSPAACHHHAARKPAVGCRLVCLSDGSGQQGEERRS